MKIRAVFSFVFALVSALMLGLAAGAMWMVPTLYSQHALPWFALPVGWVLGKAIRHWVRPAGNNAAVLAAFATFIAVLYVNVLMAAAGIAGLMGLGLVDSLRSAGLPMLLQLAELGCSPMDDVWFLAGMGLSAFVALRPAQPPKAGG
jgi:vitamin B12 transport system permease protein